MVGSMGLVYLATFAISHKNQPNVGTYSSPMDPMGRGLSGWT